MSMNYSNDILRILDDQNFRLSFEQVIRTVTGVDSGGEIVLDMIHTYYSSTPGAGNREMVLPRGYTLHIKKRGGFYLTHSHADVSKHNSSIAESVPNFLLFFRRMTRARLQD